MGCVAPTPQKQVQFRRSDGIPVKYWVEDGHLLSKAGDASPTVVESLDLQGVPEEAQMDLMRLCLSGGQFPSLSEPMSVVAAASVAEASIPAPGSESLGISAEEAGQGQFFSPPQRAAAPTTAFAQASTPLAVTSSAVSATWVPTAAFDAGNGLATEAMMTTACAVPPYAGASAEPLSAVKNYPRYVAPANETINGSVAVTQPVQEAAPRKAPASEPGVTTKCPSLAKEVANAAQTGAQAGFYPVPVVSQIAAPAEADATKTTVTPPARAPPGAVSAGSLMAATAPTAEQTKGQVVSPVAATSASAASPATSPNAAASAVPSSAASECPPRAKEVTNAAPTTVTPLERDRPGIMTATVQNAEQTTGQVVPVSATSVAAVSPATSRNAAAIAATPSSASECPTRAKEVTNAASTVAQAALDSTVLQKAPFSESSSDAKSSVPVVSPVAASATAAAVKAAAAPLAAATLAALPEATTTAAVSTEVTISDAPAVVQERWASLAARAGMRALDSKKAGFFTIEDIGRLAGEFGERLDSESMAAMLRALDADNDGIITEAEFLSALRIPSEATRRWHRWTARASALALSNGSVVNAFDYFDDGPAVRLTVDSVRRAAAELGVSLTQSEVKAMIDFADADGNGEVDDGEFQRVLALKIDLVARWFALVADIGFTQLLRGVGTISEANLRLLAEQFGEIPDDAVLQQIVSMMCVGERGREALGQVLQESASNPAARMLLTWAGRACFLSLQQEAAGGLDEPSVRITAAVLQRAARDAGSDLSADEASQLLEVADTDGNGELDQEEFSRIMRHYVHNNV